MAKIYFISDLHFGHKDVIAFDRRPFKDVEEMEAELIRKWNAKVSHDDHVFVIEEESKNGKVLEICLEELQRHMPARSCNR